MKALEDSVRSIEKDGLVWGASKLVPIGFGIKKLQINIVIGVQSSYIFYLAGLLKLVPEDEKISTDDLQEEIQGFDDYVQSTDILAMQSTF